MIDLTLHVGMGKTDTTSIQSALQHSTASLAEQNTYYLGMWLDRVSPEFAGPQGHVKLAREDEKLLEAHAEAFVTALEELSKSTGATQFILSNESLCTSVVPLLPFLNRLKSLCRLRTVAYARNPVDWLPSAYHQWMIRHKTNNGPLMDFPTAAHRLMGMYDSLPVWADTLGADFILRSFEKGTNIVDDFAQTLGLNLTHVEARRLEHSDLSESVLRAIYNGMHKTSVHPMAFQEATNRINLAKTPKVADMIEQSLDFAQTDAIVAERTSLFEDIKERSGIDLLGGESKLPATPDADPLRDRLLEQTLRISLDQADRIQRLELRIAAIKTALENTK